MADGSRKTREPGVASGYLPLLGTAQDFGGARHELRFFAVVLGVVCAGEFAVMLVLAALVPTGTLTRVQVDTGLLAVIVAPFIWHLVVYPLRLLAVMLAAIIESASDGVIIANQRGVIESFNSAAERVFSFSAREVIGRSIGVLMPSPHGESHDSYIATHVRRGVRKRGGLREVVGQRRDERAVPLEPSVSEVCVGGRVLFTSIVGDMSDPRRVEEELRRARQAAEAASRAKSAFLANMSHEIRTPMNGILGVTELLLEGQLFAEQREYLGMVKPSADSLLKVINDVLDDSTIR